jgi:hypothetical protein
MKNLKIKLAIALLTLNSVVLSQDVPETKALRASNAIRQFTHVNTLTNGGIIYQIPSMDEVKINGSCYLDSRWGKSSVRFYNLKTLFEGHFMRFDIYKNEFEFKIGNDVKVIPGEKIEDVIWVDSLTNITREVFNSSNYTIKGKKSFGFFEILEDDSIKLLKKIDLVVKEPDYNLALNVGSKNYKILRKVTYYYLIGREITQIKNKKSFQTLSIYPKINALITKENIDLGLEADLRKLFKSFKS